ncbi:hypothetical protein M758_2G019700 [Ceratodon purpureus]|nr:hypothetical protein M758_2G019700 [Ceratodon purpureus]
MNEGSAYFTVRQLAASSTCPTHPEMCTATGIGSSFPLRWLKRREGLIFQTLKCNNPGGHCNFNTHNWGCRECALPWQSRFYGKFTWIDATTVASLTEFPLWVPTL